jgi:hypothetical protein
VSSNVEVLVVLFECVVCSVLRRDAIVVSKHVLDLFRSILKHAGNKMLSVSPGRGSCGHTAPRWGSEAN